MEEVASQHAEKVIKSRPASGKRSSDDSIESELANLDSNGNCLYINYRQINDMIDKSVINSSLLYLKCEYHLTDQDDVGARMSAVFLAKVEIKEKEGNEKNRTLDNAEDKVIKRVVSNPGYYFQVYEILGL